MSTNVVKALLPMAVHWASTFMQKSDIQYVHYDRNVDIKFFSLDLRIFDRIVNRISNQLKSIIFLIMIQLVQIIHYLISIKPSPHPRNWISP